MTWVMFILSMPISFKIIVGAAITFLGVVGLVYSLAIISNAAASKGTVYTETDVPKLPDNMKMFIPLVAIATGALITGIAFMSVGSGETLPQPPENDGVAVDTGKESMVSQLDEHRAAGTP